MRHRRLLPLILLVAGSGWLAFTFLSWRADKIVMLEPPPAIEIAASSGPAEPTRLLLFGDSRIAQWKPVPERDYPIIIEGHPGETAIRLLPRFAIVLSQDRPAAAILQLGVNDAVAAAVVSPATRRRALSDTLRAIEQMAALARAHGVDLVIMAVIPPVRPDMKRRILFRGDVDAYVSAVNRSLPEIAARHGARMADPMPLLLAGEAEVPERFRRDSLHLTAEAYDALDPLVPATLPSHPLLTGQGAAD